MQSKNAKNTKKFKQITATGAIALLAAPTLGACSRNANTKNATYTPPPPITRYINQGLSGGTKGIDVSSHAGKVNWAKLKKEGNKFAYVKATEATNYINPYYKQQTTGAKNSGMLTGSYHYAMPNKSAAAAQAKHFLKNSEKWKKGGKTLPAVLDFEENPYDKNAGGDPCYGMQPKQLINWLDEYSKTYYNSAKTYPVIYTNTNWWVSCLGDAKPKTPVKLWVANYNESVGEIPIFWLKQHFWQHKAVDEEGIDYNVFNGTLSQLQNFAKSGQ